MKALRRLFLAAGAALVIAACTQDGGSIYYSIQQVQKIANSVLPLDLTVLDIVDVGGVNPYYVATGSIFVGPVPPPGGTINWQRVPTPFPNAMSNAMTWDGTNLWAGFFSADGSTFGLYTTLSLSPLTWTAKSPVAGAQITYLTAIGTNVFAVTAVMNGSSYMYTLYEYSGSWGPALPPQNLSTPITGVTLFKGVYYVTTGNIVYTGAAPGSLAAQTSLLGPGQPGDKLNGVFSDANVIIVLASSGMYWSTDGSTWTHLTDTPNGYNTGFLCAAGPVDSGNTIYLLGTDSNQGGAAGFYFFNRTAGTISRYVNLSISLYVDAIRRIMWDPVNNNAFFGTINSGLWRTSLDSNGNPTGSWVQE